MASDRAVRGKYLYLTIASALEFLRKKPKLADVEAQIELIQKVNPELEKQPEELFSKTGLLMGRLTTMAYTAIHNYELGDHSARKVAAAAQFAGQR